MKTNAHRLQRLLSAIALLAGGVTLAVTVLWPSIFQGALASRSLANVFATWLVVASASLHPEFRRGLAEGIREFRRSRHDLR